MKRTNINLTDADEQAIQVIRDRYSLTNDTAAVRLALALIARQGDQAMTQAQVIEETRRMVISSVGPALKTETLQLTWIGDRWNDSRHYGLVRVQYESVSNVQPTADYTNFVRMD